VAIPKDSRVGEGGQQSSTSMAQTGARPWAARVSRLVIAFVATGAFVGYSPIFPGTAGSVLGLLLIRFALSPISHYSPAWFLTLFGVAFIVACGVADCAERIFGESDCSAIVLDEILGMIATMFANPTGWVWLIAGFTLFRLFDIIKPWPASRFDRMRGGAGVMLDDLAAAFYANIALQVLQRLV
jgi:phosphatidylglycerophosphatase A